MPTDHAGEPQTPQGDTLTPIEDQAPGLLILGEIAVLTLRRPRVANRLTPDDLKTLQEHFETINKDPAIRVLRIESTGKYFCSGYDISSLSDPNAASSLLFGETVDLLESVRPVTIAVVQGGVYGGATDLALACDFRIGSEHANMFMPATRLGLHFYPGGLRRYAQRLGIDQAKRLFLTAVKLDAADMRACGFLTDLVSADQLTTAASELTDTLRSMAPLALFGVKHHLNEIANGRFDAQAIASNVRISEQSRDIQEGALAWREKRKPVFTGQ